ncbi:restriction endonuclease subunit S [Bacillus mycoides]|uniref:restriction endonuclease subunit S n=1 Tax=Bacillus mycoides TaxID=1405 RepID=UPI0025706E61|nr:restriction endonuclease subunit S [Bacillus mycoides]WJE59349.1 restriction endonuclease subunit S [Bacillus mycoides]
MIKPNYMEKLLEGVEVEWKTLETVIKSLKTGLNPRKKFQLNTPDSEGFYVTVREIQNGKIVFLDKTDRVDTKALELINNRSNLESGDVLFSGTGTVGRTAVIETKPINWNIKEGVYVIKPIQEIISSKYLSYLLNSQDIVSDYSRKIVGSPVVSLPMGELKKLKIPIPPLKVQEEIVRMLDIFTELTAKLTAELTARKKQYTYYRDKLFTFDEGEVEWKTLGDVGEFTRGKRFVKNDMLSEGFPCIHYGEMYTHYNIWAEKTKSFVSYDLASKLRVADHGDVVIVAAGETIEDIGKGTAWLGNTGVVIHDACFSYRSSLNPKYVSYFLRTKHFHDQIRKHISSGKISAINTNGLGKAKIPIPPLEEQARIVSILDKFDALTSSISEVLPREIELRQKQYNYYRNMLLSFPKEEVEA